MATFDMAQLYLRITIGGIILLRNIAKYQDYNSVIGDYHSVDGLSAQFWFVLFAAVESITALMLIVGVRVRLAASVLALGSVLCLVFYFPITTQLELELYSTYVFIYLYILISGGGAYSFDELRLRSKKSEVDPSLKGRPHSIT